jgi:tRNA(fMet)-specific endonuclease VapC
MNGKYLLDTNAVICFLNGNEEMTRRLESGVEVFLSTIVLGELYFGAAKSTQTAENFSRIAEFALGNTLLPCDLGTAQHYGVLKWELRTKGKPIPENDVWVAATALQHGLTIVTSDKHFDGIRNLTVEDW